MPSGKKRRKMHGISGCDTVVRSTTVTDTIIIDIGKIFENVENARDLDIFTLTKLRNQLSNSTMDNELEIQSVKSQITQKFLTGLLCRYGATESEKDKAIFDILCILERSYRVSLRPIFPLVWGERAKDNYEKLRQLGQTLHTRLTADQVLDYLDPKLMWNSLLACEQTTASEIPKVNFWKHSQQQQRQLYDARFILRLLASLVDAGAEISSRKFIEVNGLSFAFAATSFVGRCERCIAYIVLKRFLAHLMDLSAEIFPEKCLYIYLLQLFKNSIQNPIQRIPHVVAHFYARVTKLILHPEDPVYQPVLAFLLLKPNMDMENVPEMYKLLMSSSTEYHNEERHWCLRLITDSLIEPNDYNVLQKRYGVKLFLSLFASCIADMQTRKYILLSLRAMLQHRSVAHDLYVRQNLQSWIVLTLQEKKVLTRWERILLCQLFITLIAHVKEICSAAAVDSKSDDNNIVEAERRKNITRKTCQMLGNKICEELKKENDDEKAEWLPKLKELLADDNW